MIKLSIITINYNNSNGLSKTIESIISQTFTDFEFIIIDGGSTDNSVEIIKKYSDKINYWVSEKDKGIFNAQNKGIEKASGEYCLFLNSGDYLINKKVLNKVFSENYPEDILYGNMKIVWGNRRSTIGKMPENISHFQMYRDTLWHPVSFIKRQLFEKYGNYDESYKIVADYDFFFRTIIKNNVSTRYFSTTISVFDCTGISSIPKYKLLENSERERVIKNYLTETEIAELEEQLKAYMLKKKKIFNRIINKLKEKFGWII
jgi:glycosyltransferase involved in cell wall biosynthesis